MAKQIIDARVRQKIDTLANWNNNNLKLLEGEQAFVQTSDGTPVNFKIGDGDKTFDELPFFQPPITLGSISASTPLAELNMLADGVWVARGSGAFPFGLVAEEGYYTTFRKDGTTWTLDSKTEVLFTAPDVTDIRNQLDDHEIRIDDLEDLTQDHSSDISNISDSISKLQGYLNQLNEGNVVIINSYPELDNPRHQSAFNRRLYNYVVNGLANSTNFKTNTTNNVTTDFRIVGANWGLEQDLSGVMLKSLNNSTSFNSGVTWVGADGDNSAYIRKDRVGGVNDGELWSISVDGGTLPANYILPSNAETRTLPISVNGNYADSNGNIVISGGGSGIIPPATADTLGGIKVGAGLSVALDGTLSATGGGGGDIPEATTTEFGKVKYDGVTIKKNSNGQLYTEQVNTIYNSDGTLGADRTVNMGGYNLNFSNGNLKANKYGFDVQTNVITPNTLWYDGSVLKINNEFGVAKTIGGSNVITGAFNPPTLAQLTALNIKLGDFYHCSANNQRSLYDGQQLISWDCTQAEYNVLTTEQKNAVKIFNIVMI